jgi:hypothetical protein
MFIFFFLTLFLLFISPARALEEFRVNQKVHYLVDQSGNASVKQEINLTNNISQIYAKEYEFSISGSKIDNIAGGQLTSSTENLSKILVKFDKPIIGKDQTNQFFLTYTISEFAKKKGNTWEVQLPVYKHSFDDSIIQVTVEVPSYFGNLSFSSTPINSTHQLNQSTQIKFDQTQLEKKILLIFGDHQLFDFKLHYHLSNDTSKVITRQIPIPPNTDNQSVTYRNIEPTPQNVIIDRDGNWLATYNLSPGEKIDVTATGQVKTHLPIKRQHSINPSEYLIDQTYWPVNHPKITSISQSLSGPKDIHNYVINHLEYDYNRINYAKRVGALGALDNPSSSLCTEFTDLFITLARNKGIPAREIEGFAYSNDLKIKPINQNSDVLHAWPEYYDNKTQQWIPIDPTWEKTTNGIDYFNELDLNHVTFVIHGLDSQLPPPPGSYKNGNSNKSVFIDFATENLTSEIAPPKIKLNSQTLNIYNQNSTSLDNFTLKLKDNSWQSPVIHLPPFGSTEIEIPKQSFLQSILPSSKKIYLTSEGSVPYTEFSLENKNHYLNLSIFVGTTILLLCISGIILTVNIKKT